MSPTAHQLPLKMRANSAAADTNGTAVALAELPAEIVSFRWQQPSLPPHKNVNSASHSLTSACHFSGNSAICAVTSAYSLHFEHLNPKWTNRLSITDVMISVFTFCFHI
jgi:hypothetical protein